MKIWILSTLFTTIKQATNQMYKPILITTTNRFHTNTTLCAKANFRTPKQWLKYNEKIYPPQAPNEAPRLAYVCHMKTNIKYSPWKMWYIATLVRGMSVDEALRQLNFVLKKGAKDVAETIAEARQLAITKHNVEFGSNLWVAESFVGKGQVVKGIRRHAKGRRGLVEYFHCHYFVRLEEGLPPEHYYGAPLEPHEQLQKWLDQMRSRTIINSL